MTGLRLGPDSPALRILHRALRPPAHSDRPPPFWNAPLLRRRFFPDRSSLFPNRLYPLLGLVCAVLFAQWILYPIGVYYFFRSARLVTWLLFHKGTFPRVDDRRVQRVKTLRAWTAPIVSLVILAVAGNGDDVAVELAERAWTLFAAPWLLAFSAAVVVTILICCAQRDARPAMRTGLRTPLRRLLWYIGTVALLYVPLVVVAFITGSDGTGMHLDHDTWPVKVGAAVYVWVLLVFLLATARVVRTGFGLAAVHPLLPPVLTSVLIWECAALGGLPGGPKPIAYLLFISGPAVVTAISWWEIHRMRTCYGVTLRGG